MPRVGGLWRPAVGSITLLPSHRGCTRPWRASEGECLPFQSEALFLHLRDTSSASGTPPSGRTSPGAGPPASWATGLAHVIFSFHLRVCVFWPTLSFFSPGQSWEVDGPAAPCSSRFFALRGRSGFLLSSPNSHFCLPQPHLPVAAHSMSLSPVPSFSPHSHAGVLLVGLPAPGVTELLLGFCLSLPLVFVPACPWAPRVFCGSQGIQSLQVCGCCSVHKPLDLGFVPCHCRLVPF